MHRILIDELSWRSQRKSEGDLFDFLIRWFIEHTVQEDQRFGEYVKNLAAPAG